MKRGLIVFLSVIFCFSMASAANCDLSVSLVSQDPVKAVPGDYVDVIFQVSGVSNPNCGPIAFKFVPSYPFSLDPGVDSEYRVEGGVYASNYQSNFIAPYKVRVDENALDGNNLVEISYSHGVSGLTSTKKFNVSVEDVRTDFEISVRDYEFTTNTLTLEIINVGENDVEALVVEVPNQQNIQIKGSDRNIVGSLDSNEDTTFTFEGVPKDGQISVKIIYTDEVNVRREIGKTVLYESVRFTDRKRDEKPPVSTSVYVIAIIAVLLIVWFVRKRIQKRKKFSKN